MNKKIAITGGAGNLGSWLTEHFANHCYDVTVLASREREIITDAEYRFQFCDVTDLDQCKKIFTSNDFDYVIHTAGVDSINSTGEKQIDAKGTENVFNALIANPPKHVIHLSSFQVYGKYEGYISEESDMVPKNDYGKSHAIGEQMVTSICTANNIPFTIIRLTNSYGCPKDVNCSKWNLVVNDLTKVAYNQGEIKLLSNGLAPRDFIWMGTVCNVFESLLGMPATNDVYNLSGQSTLKMIDIAETVRRMYLKVYGKELPITTNKEDSTVYSDDLMVSSEKLRKVVAIEDKVMFEQEVENILRFVEKHKVK